MRLFQRLADDIAAQIRAGTLRPGERIPSVREISRERTLSTATVVRAYEWLEGQGFLETRPRSGFYVSTQWKTPGSVVPGRIAPASRVSRSTLVDVSELVFEVLESVRDRQLIPFGSAFPSPLLFPMTRLARCLSLGARRMDQWGTLDDLPPGSLELRRQIARRYLRSGARVAPEEIVITSGALEALNLSLQILTRPGDIVAVAKIEDLWSGKMRRLEVNGKCLLLVNVDDRVYAYADICPHQKSRLSEGTLTGKILDRKSVV